MAKRPSAVKSESKSDAIRGVLKQHPKATAAEIRAALKERGVKASDALINKIKYGRGSKSKSRKSGAALSNGAHGSKAEAIRSAWSEMGAGTRPRDIVARLAQRGIKVSSAQVSALRKSAGRRSSGVLAVSSVRLEHLLAAKHLVRQLGGIDAARTALSNLARLVE